MSQPLQDLAHSAVGDRPENNWMDGELRLDHAGEYGAVVIYDAIFLLDRLAAEKREAGLIELLTRLREDEIHHQHDAAAGIEPWPRNQIVGQLSRARVAFGGRLGEESLMVIKYVSGDAS